MNRVLIVSAHPDDDILGCGGFIAKHRFDKAFKVIFLAEGTSCRYAPNQLGSEAVISAIENRTNAAKKALSVLGVEDVAFYDYPCGQLDQVPILTLNKIIEKEIAAYQPDTVLTHFEEDNNNDHRILYRSVLMATRPVGLQQIPNLLSFEVPSSTEWSFSSSFQPNYFEQLNHEDILMKWEALACYESEICDYPHPRSQKGLEVLAQYRGLQVGVPYAEAFKLIRKVSK